DERDENRDLQEERANAAQRVGARFPVELHDLFLPPLGVAVLLVDLLDLRLDRLHRLRRVNVAKRQRERGRADQDGERDDRQAEAVEQQMREQHQQVHERVQQDQGEDFANHFFTPLSTISTTRRFSGSARKRWPSVVTTKALF